VVIVGGDGVSYGAPPPPRSTYRDMMLEELGSKLDRTRVHFLGLIAHEQYLDLLQVSSAHVYLTYPFVLSWSFIEAMASGCLVIGSSTPPVLEVLRDGANGVAVDFFATRALASRIEAALLRPAEFEHLRDAARETAVKHFDLKRVLLPRWMSLFDDLIEGRRPEGYRLELARAVGSGT
jgi:glycosyltransferase involved in cell wall biosynthesis